MKNLLITTIYKGNCILLQILLIIEEDASKKMKNSKHLFKILLKNASRKAVYYFHDDFEGFRTNFKLIFNHIIKTFYYNVIYRGVYYVYYLPPE